MTEPILTIQNVSKEYRLGTIGYGTLYRDLQSWWAKIRKKEDPNRRIDGQKFSKDGKFLALDHVSFSVGRGETVGLIGKNGAGKSTLLKLLSRITAPTDGEIRYEGRISSMLEVGTGFHPELTGRENVYLNGTILGMKKAEITEKMEEIIAFSGVADFIDTPVKRYSSGMLVKLAFSVAAHLNGDVLLMDEVLAVGDLAFQKKSVAKMQSIARDEGRTVLIVSHNMQTIRDLCSRVIVLDEGKVLFDGDTEEGIRLYTERSVVPVPIETEKQ